MTITCLIGVAVLASPVNALLVCPGVELKLEASKTAEVASRATERVTWSAQALVELLCFFHGVVPFGSVFDFEQILVPSQSARNHSSVNFSLQ